MTGAHNSSGPRTHSGTSKAAMGSSKSFPGGLRPTEKTISMYGSMAQMMVLTMFTLQPLGTVVSHPLTVQA
jgi:hypothetical protein